MRFRVCVLLIIGCGFIPACAPFSAPEVPPLETVSFVDVEQYMGKWYEIAAFPMFFQRNCVGDTTAEYALRPDGDIVVYGSGKPEIALPFFPTILKNIRLRFFIVYNLGPADRAAAIEQLSAWLREGRLQHVVSARIALEAIAEAHQLVETGAAVGNVVLQIP